MKRLFAACLQTLFVACTIMCWAQPAKVFVFNDNADRTNQFAKNYIWQDLGLSDANGQMGTIQANGDITIGGNTVGSVIKNGAGQVIGYRNADGTKEAYDVDKTTTDMAWMAVANDGCLVIMKHGGGTNGTTGGGIHLDGSQSFDGFGQGTQAGFRNNRTKQPSGPYPLTPRPGANIKLVLYVCNGGTDPDGGGPKKSVGESAAGVPGVGSVSAFPRKLAGTITPMFKQGNIEAQRKALRILRKAAKEAGFGDAKTDLTDKGLNSWILSLPANTRYSTINNLIASTGACIKLVYSTDPPVDVDAVDAFEPVLQAMPGFIGTYTIMPPIEELSMSLVISPGDLALPELFQMDKLSASGPPPVGRWGTAAWDLREMDYEGPTPGGLEYRLQYAGNPALARPMVFDFTAGMWMPVPTWIVVGNEVVFELPGAHMVAVAELANRVPVISYAAAQGTIVDAGVWDPADSDMDAVIKSGGVVAVANQKVSKLQVDYDCSAPGALFDVRGVASVGAGSGVLTVEALNVNTGLYQTIGTFALTPAVNGFRIENVPGSLFFNGSKALSLRYKCTVSVPTALPTVNTTYPGLQVTVHD